MYQGGKEDVVTLSISKTKYHATMSMQLNLQQTSIMTNLFKIIMDMVKVILTIIH